VSAFARRLLEPRPLLLDGGLGTQLIAAGLEAGQPPERWVLEHPERVLAVHRDYVAAGAELIHPCTFGANRLRLRPFGMEDRLEEINTRAVALARQAGAPWVLGDIGPVGEYLPPVGKGDPEIWRGAFEEQAALLARQDIDGFHIETMSDLREARVALAAIQAVAPALPVMVSMTFDRKRRGFFTVMGDPLAASLRALAHDGAVAVGANCSITSPDMRDLATEALAAVVLPVVLQPNAGQPRVTAEGVVYDQDPAAFVQDVAAMARAGVRVVGGCCGSDPGFIAGLRAALDG
jgi:5-methyltetrahydrofolate--homocysteine methyltransferase